MALLQELQKRFEQKDSNCFSQIELTELSDGLKKVQPSEIHSVKDGSLYITLLKKFREAVAGFDRFNGEQYPQLLNSLLSVGQDGLYSDKLRFIFELIQNVDDCDYSTPDDCRLDMKFDFNQNEIILTYNEVGFTPFNVFAITGIAEAAKNITSYKNEIGEKGIGFKSVFGVAYKVLIQSGWFSFELYKNNFTIPVVAYDSEEYVKGTQMTLFISGGGSNTRKIYNEVTKQYFSKDALFTRNPLLFLNKLTSLKMYFDSWRCLEFQVSRNGLDGDVGEVKVERDVEIKVQLCDDKALDGNIKKTFYCSRYSYPVVYSKEACLSRYGEKSFTNYEQGKTMVLQVIMPNKDFVDTIGKGVLYSFLPTQLKLTVPMVCHVPFKLDASREFVDSQNENLWFRDSCSYFSKLIDYVYKDWSNVVKEDIVKYLPDENLFARNNGKEQCLRTQKVYSKNHYLELPLFHTIDGLFHSAEDIFCFDRNEEIAEPEKVYKLLEFTGFLFLPTTSVNKFNFRIEKDIKNRLFERALINPSITKEALEYLSNSNYIYTEDQLRKLGTFELTVKQIEIIMEQPKLAKVFQKVGCSCVKNGIMPGFYVEGSPREDLKQLLSKNFDLSEAPRQVETYIKKCELKCICINFDKDKYLPCGNAIMLSSQDPFASFSEFCKTIDPKDTFVIRMMLRKASDELNKSVENSSVSASEFLRKLGNIRRLIKESLGAGYKNYINLILNAGLRKERFLQELLQNADDCEYPPDVIPEFSLLQNGTTVITEHNEVGFTRANIRSITAIGESTKEKLLSSVNVSRIGAKGIGFKTVFAVASEVRIHSGEYHFALTNQEPTIPSTKNIPNTDMDPVVGTRMEFVLYDQSILTSFNEKSILALCLCLRKLKKINVLGQSVNISDSDDKRVITINGKPFSFNRFIHDFIVKDKDALKEYHNGFNTTEELQQRIVCLVPDKNITVAEFFLYNGLPTLHKLKIPMIVDAPFELTTSRDRINEGKLKWNSVIRNEVYAAISNVIEKLKFTERSSVLRFINYNPRRYGTLTVYENDTSDCPYLNEYDFISRLKKSDILPTFDHRCFVSPFSKKANRYPEVAIILFRNKQYAGIKPATIIDVKSSEYGAVLNALGCEVAPYNTVFPIIEFASNSSVISNEEFRKKLYEYLSFVDLPESYKDRLRKLPIIPVFGKNSGITVYKKWSNDSIFVKRGATISGSNYDVLNEKVLSKAVCELIFNVTVNEMNSEWEHNRYNEKLKTILQGNNKHEIYTYLLNEFRCGELQRHSSFDTLYARADLVPLKNEMGEIVRTKLYLCNEDVGYFTVKVIKQLIVHSECKAFAQFLHCTSLKDIHYDNISYFETLTAEDVEQLSDDYFTNSEEILRGFYRANLLPDELMRENGLEYITVSPNLDSQFYQFPEDKVGNRQKLSEHIQKLFNNPVKVVTVEVNRKINKGKKMDGTTFSLDIGEAREHALHTYTPEGARKECFCQMCKKVKPYSLMEVNNIEIKPKYFFPEMRLALCLECSKRFEFLRGNTANRMDFIDRIKRTVIAFQKNIAIPLGKNYTITFTGKHLAEIQEILKRIDK